MKDVKRTELFPTYSALVHQKKERSSQTGLEMEAENDVNGTNPLWLKQNLSAGHASN